MLSAFYVLAEVLKRSYYSKEFAVVRVVVAFGCNYLSREEGDRHLLHFAIYRVLLV